MKKPLMQKVSTRHLNEIVRERNQYSRDASEAWQDFINLKGRQDTEIAKVSKRNAYLVEEIESWKAQFLKIQTWAETINKETQDLKVKIENHKRENRRLASLADQNQEDMQRIATRLTGTEKQRDDALEALVLQQEIAEELERERKRNKKELASLQAANNNLLRQRDDATRAAFQMRATLDGQAHHIEHVVKSLHNAPEMQNMFEEQSGEGAADSVDGAASSRLPASRLSMSNVADRYLREKTDSITYIIRNISEQCAAAVEGLQVAQRAENHGDGADNHKYLSPDDSSVLGDMAEDETNRTDRTGRDSMQTTPDLISHNRTSTAMSYTTEATTVRDSESVPDLPHAARFEPKVVSMSDEHDLPAEDLPLSKGFPAVRTLEGERLRGLA